MKKIFTPEPELESLSSKQIRQLLTNLPEERLLQLTKTIDQLYFWLLHRFIYTGVAAAWIAKREGQDDPIRAFLDSGELCQNDYNRIWRLVDYYERLWTLVYRVEPFVKETLTKTDVQYPFENSYDLFVCILREQTSNEFSYCLSPYSEFSGTKSEKEYRQLVKLLDKEPLSKQQIKNLQVSPTEARLKKHKWSMLLLAIAYTKVTRRRSLVKDALEDFNTAVARLFEDEATHCRIQGSYAWIDGDKVKGSRASTYQKQKS
ncbi:hypothetical protein QT972_18325 [Microcoleus sp. herbarium7]|uniref:hypothetical protein n=1 Tax=Microcoleus sp. herbarium7 TaxID=3055435 RepID=UPI002FD5BA0E